MITQVTLANYRSLGAQVEVRLRPLTVLVGINGAGKSNVADALRFVGDAVREGLEHAVASRQGFASLRRWSRGRPFDVWIVLEVVFDEIEWDWGIRLTADRTTEFRVKEEFAFAGPSLANAAAQFRRGGMIAAEPDADVEWQSSPLGSYHVKEGAFMDAPRPDLNLTPPPRSLVLPEIAKLDPRFQPLADHLSGMMVYSIFPPTLRLPQSSDPTRPMRRQGENWATHLRALDRDTQGAELLAALGRVVGDIDDYKVSAVGGYLIPEFRHGADGTRERWFGAAQESDGTLRMAGILTALLQTPSPSLIGIEEPELAVHAAALPLLVDYMKQAAAQTQVIVTSHSPDLLDLLDPGDLRVVERGDEGTTVTRLAREQLEAVRNKLCATSDLLHVEGLQGDSRG